MISRTNTPAADRKTTRGVLSATGVLRILIIIQEAKLGYYVSNNAFADYHFMIWNPNGYWLHKPGTTAILKYKYTSISSTWYPEAYMVGTGWVQDATFTYKGIVKYVVY